MVCVFQFPGPLFIYFLQMLALCTYLWPEVLWSIIGTHMWGDINPYYLFVERMISTLPNEGGQPIYTVHLGCLSATSTAQEAAP